MTEVSDRLQKTTKTKDPSLKSLMEIQEEIARKQKEIKKLKKEETYVMDNLIGEKIRLPKLGWKEKECFYHDMNFSVNFIPPNTEMTIIGFRLYLNIGNMVILRGKIHNDEKSEVICMLINEIA